MNNNIIHQEPARAAGEKSDESDPAVNSDGSPNLYCGISACPEDLHVHVKCEPDFIHQLFRLAEPELSGLRQERHAKNIEIAQKEVLTCIGLALFERFQRIQQKLREAEQTCDLLFLTLLKTLRMSLDLAAERKRGIGDLELLCEELEKEEKKKEGKKEKKRNRKSKKKEGKNAAPTKICLDEDDDDVKLGSDDESNSGDSGVSSVDCHKDVVKEKDDANKENHHPININNNSFKLGLTLEEMLEDNFEEDLDDDEDLIPQEDIKQFLDKREDMALRRQQLRENLKFRFDQLCVKYKCQ